MTDTLVRGIRIGTVGRRVSTRSFMRRKSMIAFLFALPLIANRCQPGDLSGVLRDTPRHLNKGMQRFVGFDNFLFLFKTQHVLDGGRAIGAVRRHRGHFQGSDRVCRCPFRA